MTVGGKGGGGRGGGGGGGGGGRRRRRPRRRKTGRWRGRRRRGRRRRWRRRRGRWRMRGRRRRRRLRRRRRRHDLAAVDLDHARGRAACSAPVHHIGVLVKVHASDGLGAVEPNVRDVAEALAIDTVASAVARLVATVRVLRVTHALEIELGARDRASGVVAVSIVQACIGVCVARQWAGRGVDRHENDQGVRVVHAAILGHLVGAQGTIRAQV